MRRFKNKCESAGNRFVKGILHPLLFGILIIGLASSFGLGAPGDLDTSFGVGGKVVTPVGSGRDLAQAIAVQPDGKMVVVGSAQNDFAVLRYNADGTLDSGFGTGGKVITSVSTFSDEANAIALQTNGKIVVVGLAGQDFGVVRYNSDGTLDTSFGTAGTIVTHISGFDIAEALIIQPDGKIVAAGTTDLTQIVSKFALVRYNADGTLDTTFGTAGKVISEVSSRGGVAHAAVLQSDGKIVIGGESNVDVGQSTLYKLTVARYNSNGSIDSSFGTNGVVVISLSDTTSGRIYDVGIQTDGKLVAAGTNDAFGIGDTAVLRYTANGSLDSTFGANGVFTTRVGTIASIGEALCIQSNGKIVVAGSSLSGSGTGGNNFSVLRLNSNGTFDTTFGSNGQTVTQIGTRHDQVRDAVIQADGKIIVAGHSEDSTMGFNEDFALVRYLGDLVATHHAAFDFDGDGRTDHGVFRPSEGVWYLQNSQTGFSAIQWGASNDKLVPADYDGDGKTDIAVYRDGVWYLMRSSAGIAIINFGLSSDIPTPADYDGDGKAEISIYRPSNGNWWMLNLATDQVSAIQFGVSEDKPVTADYDGDGKADIAVYRPSSGVWYILRSSEGFGAVQFGVATDKPVPADYDGDGKSDQAVYREGAWWLLRSSAGVGTTQFGLPNDAPIVGDYDGDGKSDISVWRASDGIHYLLLSGSGNQFSAFKFGVNGDRALANSYVR